MAFIRLHGPVQRDFNRHLDEGESVTTTYTFSTILIPLGNIPAIIVSSDTTFVSGGSGDLEVVDRLISTPSGNEVSESQVLANNVAVNRVRITYIAHDGDWDISGYTVSVGYYPPTPDLRFPRPAIHTRFRNPVDANGVKYSRTFDSANSLGQVVTPTGDGAAESTAEAGVVNTSRDGVTLTWEAIRFDSANPRVVINFADSAGVAGQQSLSSEEELTFVFAVRLSDGITYEFNISEDANSEDPYIISSTQTIIDSILADISNGIDVLLYDSSITPEQEFPMVRGLHIGDTRVRRIYIGDDLIDDERYIL